MRSIAEAEVRRALVGHFRARAEDSRERLFGFVPSTNPGEIRMGMMRDVPKAEMREAIAQAVSALQARGFHAYVDMADIVVEE